MKYDGILFDLDGTLWDSTEAVAASWKIALQGQPDVEAPPTREQLEGVMGMTGEQLMATLYPQLSPPAASGAVRPVLPSGKWISAGARGASLSQPGGDLGQALSEAAAVHCQQLQRGLHSQLFRRAPASPVLYRLGVYWTDGPAKGGKYPPSGQAQPPRLPPLCGGHPHGPGGGRSGRGSLSSRSLRLWRSGRSAQAPLLFRAAAAFRSVKVSGACVFRKEEA